MNCVELIALANRLWLPRLVSLVEGEIVKQLSSRLPHNLRSSEKNDIELTEYEYDSGTDLSEESLSLLQPCQVRFK